MINTLPNLDINKIKAAIAGKTFGEFIPYVNPQYIVKDFHAYIISRLELFAEGKIKKLMVFMPPQHGKSQLTTRMFPAYLLGKNPEKKIVISSYSATIAHEFARDVKNIATSPSYREVFPKTVIGKSKMSDGSYSDASYYYHTVPYKGFVYAVGRGGSITSKTVDIGIIDDPLKGRDEANSLQTKEKLWRWYKDDYRTRMHNDSQELLIQTRWAEDDLAGRILKEEADEWEVIIFPAIKTEDYSLYDNRQPGEALWPEKHSLARLLKAQKTNETSFDSLYQQNPKPNNKLLVHPDFISVETFPYELINKWLIGYDYGMNDETVAVAIGCLENKRYWKTLLYKPGREIIKDSKEAVVETDTDRVNGIIVEALYQAVKANGLLSATGFSEHDRAKILQLNGKGLAVYMANKSVSSGIEKVNEFDNYYLSSDLQLYNEQRIYQFKTIGEIVLDVPVDGNDHIMNAGRYAIYTDAILNNL